MSDLIQISPNYCREGQEAFIALAIRTYVGMAHLAGSGPAGKTCRECAFWRHRNTWQPEDMEHQGEPQPAPCQKYKAFTHQSQRAAARNKVPHDAASCKHFAESEQPQPLRRPEKVSV